MKMIIKINDYTYYIEYLNHDSNNNILKNIPGEFHYYFIRNKKLYKF